MMLEPVLPSICGSVCCICCSLESIERNSNVNCASQVYHSQLLKSSLRCEECKRHQNLDCVRQFVDRMKSSLSKSALEVDNWFNFCVAINYNIPNQVLNIPRGICCDFKPTFTESTMPKTTPSSECYIEDLCESINDILLNEEMDVDSCSSSSKTKECVQDGVSLPDSSSSSSVRKDCISNIKSSWTKSGYVSGDPLYFLSKYHNETPHRTKSLHKLKWSIVSKIIARDFQRRKPELMRNNRFAGALYFPSHQLLIQSQACNSFLYTDIHAVAKSNFDNSKGVPHAVISERNSNELVNYIHNNRGSIVCSKFPPHLTSRFTVNIITLNNVPSPEDSTKTRDWVVQVLTIKQKEKLSQSILRKGMKFFPSEELIWSSFFGYSHVHKHADVTMILGDLSLEENKVPKLLLLRFHSMINCNIADDRASILLNSLRCVAGKQGYELNRVGGSSGTRTPTSDHDFLRVMNEVPSALPRKCGACKIIPFRLGYRIFYKKRKPKQGKHPIAYTTYSVPTPGGSFSMKNETMVKFPHIGEMAYLKMVAACIIQTYNTANNQDIAKGPLLSEFQHINICRQQYNQQRNYYRFISFYNSFNSYSAVFTNVGIHNDHFSKRKESLENKCLFEDWNYDRCLGTKGCGRGGTYIKRDNKSSLVVAILDWNNVSRAKRGFVHANHVAIGCDPNARLSATLEHQIMESSVAAQYTQTIAIANVDEGLEGTADGDVGLQRNANIDEVAQREGSTVSVGPTDGGQHHGSQDGDSGGRGGGVGGGGGGGGGGAGMGSGTGDVVPIMHTTREATKAISDSIDNFVSQYVTEALEDDDNNDDNDDEEIDDNVNDGGKATSELSDQLSGKDNSNVAIGTRITENQHESQLHDDKSSTKHVLSHPARGQFSKDYLKNVRIENERKVREREHQAILERANPEYRQRMEKKRREDESNDRALRERINERMNALREEELKRNRKK